MLLAPTWTKKCLIFKQLTSKGDPVLCLLKPLAYRKSKLLPILGGTRLKNKTNYKVGIPGDFEKVKPLLGLFKRSGNISELRNLSSFNSFDRLYS